MNMKPQAAADTRSLANVFHFSEGRYNFDRFAEHFSEMDGLFRRFGGAYHSMELACNPFTGLGLEAFLLNWFTIRQ